LVNIASALAKKTRSLPKGGALCENKARRRFALLAQALVCWRIALFVRITFNTINQPWNQ
jgi:hypothetical protein